MAQRQVYNVQVDIQAVVRGVQLVQNLTNQINQATQAGQQLSRVLSNTGGTGLFFTRLNQQIGGVSSVTSQAGSAFAGMAQQIVGANFATQAINATIEASIRVFSAVSDAVSDFVREGIRMNAKMETVQLSIQAITAASLVASGTIKDTGKAFALAGPEAERQLQALRVEALLTTATFEGLATAFQQAVGPGLARGLNLDQIRQLTIQIGQAGKSIGMPDFQLPQEVRALFEGKIDRNARVAKMLEITAADINKFKGNAQGLFDFLNERTQAFKLSGDVASKTFAGLASNVKDAFSFVAASGTTKTFETLKNVLGDVQKQLIEIRRDGEKIVGLRVAPSLQPILEILDRAGQIVGGLLRGAVAFIGDRVRAIGEALSANQVYVDAVLNTFKLVGQTVLDIGANILNAMSFKQPQDALQAVRAIMLVIRGVLKTYELILVPLVKLITGIVSLGGKLMTLYDSIADAIKRASAATAEWAHTAEKSFPILSAIARRFSEMGNEAANAMGGGTPRPEARATSSLRLLSPRASELRLMDEPLPTGTRTPGDGKGGKNKYDDALIKEMNRRIAELKDAQATEAALADVGFEKFKDTLDRELEAFRDSYQQRKVGITEFYEYLKANRTAAADAEVREAKRKVEADNALVEGLKRELQAAEGIQDEEKKKAEKGRIENEIRDIIRKRIKDEGDLELAERRRADAGIQAAREERDANKKLDDDIQAIKDAQGEAIGSSFEVQARKIKRDFENSIRDIKAELEKLNKIPETDLTKPQIERKQELESALQAAEGLKAAKLADLDLSQAQADLQFVLNELKREEAAIEADMTREGYTRAQIDRAKLRAAQEYLPVLREIQARINAAATANPTTANTNAARDAQAEISQIGRTGMTVGGQIRQFLLQPFTQLFQSLMTGSQSAGEAFRAFASSVIGSITQMIAQLLALWVVQKLVGVVGGFFGGPLTGLGSGAAGAGQGAGSAIASITSGVIGGGRAKGGYVDPSKLYWVGENGPELVGFGQNASVLNSLNSQNLASMMDDGWAERRNGAILQSLRQQMPQAPRLPEAIPGVGAGGPSGFDGEITILNLTDRKQYFDMLRSREGRAVIGNIISSMPNTMRKFTGGK